MAASLSMIFAYLGQPVSTNDLMKATGVAANGPVNVAQLQKASTAYGLGLTYVRGTDIARLSQELSAGKPSIVIIHYGSLPRRQDVNFTGSHAVLVVGTDDQSVYINDPDYFGARRPEGDHKPYSHAEFLKAWNDATLDGNSARSCLIPSRGGAEMNVDQPTLDFLYQLIFHRAGPGAASGYIGQALMDVLKDMSLSGLWKELDAKLNTDIEKLIADAVIAAEENVETDCELAFKAAAEAYEAEKTELFDRIKTLESRPICENIEQVSAIELIKELVNRLFQGRR
jgi:uncharacterized protein YvpB